MAIYLWYKQSRGTSFYTALTFRGPDFFQLLAYPHKSTEKWGCKIWTDFIGYFYFSCLLIPHTTSIHTPWVRSKINGSTLSKKSWKISFSFGSRGKKTPRYCWTTVVTSVIFIFHTWNCCSHHCTCVIYLNTLIYHVCFKQNSYISLTFMQIELAVVNFYTSNSVI